MIRRRLALEALRDAGKHGVTTAGLLKAGAGSRYGARLKELREEGHEISSVRLRDGEWLYTLVSEPDVELCRDGEAAHSQPTDVASPPSPTSPSDVTAQLSVVPESLFEVERKPANAIYGDAA